MHCCHVLKPVSVRIDYVCIVCLNLNRNLKPKNKLNIYLDLDLDLDLLNLNVYLLMVDLLNLGIYLKDLLDLKCGSGSGSGSGYVLCMRVLRSISTYMCLHPQGLHTDDARFLPIVLPESGSGYVRVLYRASVTVPACSGSTLMYCSPGFDNRSHVRSQKQHLPIVAFSFPIPRV